MYTSKEMYEILKEKGVPKLSNDMVTGEEYDKWRNDRFIKEVDKSNE